jgi:peptidoglycan hydrolase CwlO-like protein
MIWITLKPQRHFATVDDIAELKKMMRKLMAQVDTLKALLATIAEDVTTLLGKAKSLEEQLTTLQQTTPPQVDLTDAINAATAIREQLEGTAANAGEGSPPPADGSGSADATP